MDLKLLGEKTYTVVNIFSTVTLNAYRSNFFLSFSSKLITIAESSLYKTPSTCVFILYTINKTTNG